MAAPRSHVIELTLNESLSKLKQLINRFEGRHDAQKNASLPSLYSEGVWLLTYALMDETQRPAVIAALEGVTDMPEDDIIDLLNLLTEPKTLRTILRILEASGTLFTLSVSDEKTKVALKAKAKELKLDTPWALNRKGWREWLDKHFLVDKTNVKAGGLDISLRSKTEIELPLAGDINYENAVDYKLVKLDNSDYHVVRLRVSNEDNGKDTFAYVIEPVNSEDKKKIQDNFSILIEAFEKNLNSESYKNNKRLKEKKLSSLKITESYDSLSLKEKLSAGNVVNVDQLLISLPALHDIHKLTPDMTTKDKRPGAFSVFAGRNILGMCLEHVSFQSTRTLSYTTQSARSLAEASEASEAKETPQKKTYTNIIKTEYKPVGAFMLVVNNGYERSPFIIANPREELNVCFFAGAAAAVKPVSSTASVSLFLDSAATEMKAEEKKQPTLPPAPAAKKAASAPSVTPPKALAKTTSGSRLSQFVSSWHRRNRTDGERRKEAKEISDTIKKKHFSTM